MRRTLCNFVCLAALLALAAPAAAQDEKPGVAEAARKAAKKSPAKRAKQAKRKPAVQRASKESFIVDRVAAVVNDAIILESELARRVVPLAADLEDISDIAERARRQKLLAGKALDDMVNEELILGAAEEAKLEVSEKEVDNALAEIKKQNEVDDAGLAKALEMQGYSMSAYRSDVKKQIMRMRAVNVLVRPRVTITDEDVRAAYDHRSRRSGAVSKVRLHHILVTLPETPTQQQLAAAKAKASEVIDKVRDGEKFAELAERYSDDVATSSTGGEIGWIERGSIPTEWEAIVFGMAKGEVRGPISGPSGLHVFYVSDLEQMEQKPFDEVKEQIRNDLYGREMDRETLQWLDEQRKKAHVELKL